MAILTDARIALLLADPKPIRRSQIKTLKRSGKPKNRGSAERQITVTSDGKRSFTIIVNRKSDPKYFSVILSFTYYGKTINLVRCDIHKRPHTNPIEDLAGIGIGHISGKVPHVHFATQRYQLAGHDAETYAEPTDAFFSCDGAIEFLSSRFGFYLADDCYSTLYPLLDQLT